MVLTVSFQIGGGGGRVTLKGKNFFLLRVAHNMEGDGLRQSHENVHPFPS